MSLLKAITPGEVCMVSMIYNHPACMLTRCHLTVEVVPAYLPLGTIILLWYGFIAYHDVMKLQCDLLVCVRSAHPNLNHILFANLVQGTAGTCDDS